MKDRREDDRLVFARALRRPRAHEMTVPTEWDTAICEFTLERLAFMKEHKEF